MGMPLFAQVNDGPFGRIDATTLFVLLAVLMAALGVAVAFLATLSNALQLCRPDHRAMKPGMVWLNLVPLLNIVWQFVTVLRVADSLQREFAARRSRQPGDYGRGLGIACCVLGLLAFAPDAVGTVAGLAGLVCFILYWVKVAGLSRQLTRPYYGTDGEEFPRGRAAPGDGGEPRNPWGR